MASKEVIVSKIGYGNLLAIGVVSSKVSYFDTQFGEYPYPGILFTAKNSEEKNVVMLVLMEEEDLFSLIWTLGLSGLYQKKEDVTSQDLGKTIRNILGK